MENKCNKKSNYQQLQALVEYMDEHPDFARGGVVYGSSKVSTEEQWVQLVKKLNSLGPPIRAIVEWKKTWADLKSRTKKKIAENNKSIRETGGGMYRMCNLTELEQTIDRALSLNKSAAPSGGRFGYADCINSSVLPVNQAKHLQTLKDAPPRSSSVVPAQPRSSTVVSAPPRGSTVVAAPLRSCTMVADPPRSSTVVAVITPTRQQLTYTSQPTLQINPSDTQDDWFLPLEDNIPQQPPQKRKYSDTEDELPGCSSAKKLKSKNEQISLIRRQIRISESSAATAKEHAEATKTLAEATKALVAAVTRMADAVEKQADAVNKIAETQAKILVSVDSFRSEVVDCFLKK